MEMDSENTENDQFDRIFLNPIIANVLRYPNLPLVEGDQQDEWMYIMRRTMQEIIPGLFLGPYAAATRKSLGNMLAAGITHVVCVRSNIEAHLIRANHMDHFQYLLVQMDDSPLEPIIPQVKTVSAFIETCLNSGGKVLVHGNAGMSRSAALIVGFMMSKFGVTFKKSVSYVQGKRFCINISESFANQLKEYEPIYRAMHSTPKLLPGENLIHNGGSMKRKVDDIVEFEDMDRDVDGIRPRMENNDGMDVE